MKFLVSDLLFCSVFCISDYGSQWGELRKWAAHPQTTTTTYYTILSSSFQLSFSCSLDTNYACHTTQFLQHSLLKFWYLYNYVPILIVCINVQHPSNSVFDQKLDEFVKFEILCKWYMYLPINFKEDMIVVK